MPHTRHADSRARPIRLHSHPLSGHAHRVELFLSLLGLPFEKVHVDFASAEHKSPAFLALNPFGQLPVIEDGDLVLADSNAILVYLALKHDTEGRWLPRDALGAAQVQRWLSVAAGQLAFGPAAARVAVLFGRPIEQAPRDAAASLFKLMAQHLAANDFFAAPHPTIADIALYAYTAHAPEGGVSLAPYPALQRWLARIEALPGFVWLHRSPVLETTA
ncbi:MAG: glutathione S-transferase [Rhizobiales bacterium]|nr:glutathione S-transferase [Rhizobacter sp.]